jgi:hypothetical protein
VVSLSHPYLIPVKKILLIIFTTLGDYDKDEEEDHEFDFEQVMKNLPMYLRCGRS